MPDLDAKTGELIFSVIDNAGHSELYRGDMKTGSAQKFLHLPSNQLSPSWSPFASEVLFTSDRGGSPQVYAVGRDGTDVRRITFMGHYNERASWSPEGDRIVYTSMDDGKMNIYTCGQIDSPRCKVSVSDLNGRKYFERKFENSKGLLTIDVSLLSSGTYVLEVAEGDVCTLKEKFIKK